MSTFNVHIKPRKTSPDSAAEIFTAAQFVPAIQKIDSPKSHLAIEGSVYNLRTMALTINVSELGDEGILAMDAVDKDGEEGGLSTPNSAGTNALFAEFATIHKSKAFIRIGEKHYDLRTITISVD